MREIPRLVIVLVLGVLLATMMPVLAVSVVRYARNAGRVDGYDAVGSSVSRSRRAEKLVATDSQGFLPDNVIRTAPDARQLGGRPPLAYDPNPCAANVAAHALVPRDASGAAAGIAFVHVPAGRDAQGARVFTCDERNVTANRVAPGTYEVDFGGAASCTNGAPPAQMRTSVTVKSGVGPPLLANTASVCHEDDRMIEVVRVMEASGVPTDASFTIILMGSLPIPPIP